MHMKYNLEVCLWVQRSPIDVSYTKDRIGTKPDLQYSCYVHSSVETGGYYLVNVW